MSGGGIVHQSIAIITHPEYDVSKLINDVAVVQTATTIIFTAFAQPISVGSEYIGAGVLATATGWGTIGVSLVYVCKDFLLNFYFYSTLEEYHQTIYILFNSLQLQMKIVAAVIQM